MRDIKINSKKLFTVLLAGFIIIGTVGCKNKKDSQINNEHFTESNVIEHNTEVPIEVEDKITIQDENQNSSKDKEEITVEENNNIVENSTQEQNYTSDDKEVINYFNDIETKVEEELKKESNEKVKDKLKGTFIMVVDFLFYDSEINGIKFDDLTESAKQNILETISSIDNKIMAKYPNYKEEISVATSKAYNKASELIKKGANNVRDFSKDKLGEENYNSIIEAKDELVYYTKNALSIIGDIAGGIWETSKSKIKSWYENFKN